MTATLLSLVENDTTPSPTALILPHLTPPVAVSYAELQRAVVALRDVLAHDLGVATADVVATSFANGLEFIVAFLAIAGARAIAAPLNPAYTAPEVQFYLDDTKPVLLLLPALAALDPAAQAGARAALAAAAQCGVPAAELALDAGGRPRVRLIAGSRPRGTLPGGNGAPQPADVALVLHTSGTTSRPKTVPLAHANLLASADNVAATYALAPADRSYLVMPLFHVHGLVAGLLAPLRARASAVVPPRFSAARFWGDVAAHACSFYTAVPTIHAILLATPLPPGGPPPLRFIRSCSASLAPVLLERLEAAFRAPVLEAYAMTEAAHQIASNRAGARVPGTVGTPVGAVAVSVRDAAGAEVPAGARGEVCVRGANVTAGYAGAGAARANAAAFWPGAWLRTGDEGRLDPASGHLQLTGRLKELISRGGEKIAPPELDAALLRVPGVAEAVAFGVPHAVYGEAVWAGVVLAPGAARAGAPARVRAALVGALAPFKIPERVVVVDAIPKTATGKVQRRHVREALIAQAKAEDEAKAAQAKAAQAKAAEAKAKL